MIVEVVGIRRVNRGSLLAFADVQFGDIIIHDWRILQQPGRELWVGLPVRTWISTGGERFHAPLVTLEDGIKEQAVNGILEAWEEFGYGNTGGSN